MKSCSIGGLTPTIFLIVKIRAENVLTQHWTIVDLAT
jgi:hypothetical protein